jgi:hypothetical protein
MHAFGWNWEDISESPLIFEAQRGAMESEVKMYLGGLLSI